MPQTLTIIAQQSMDLVLRSFRVQTDFFDIEDYIRVAGLVMGDIYRQAWVEEYAKLRAKGRQEELVTFSPELLLEQELEVTSPNSGFCATFKYQPFTFLYDKHSCGIQAVFPVTPADAELERSSIFEKYQFQYYPQSCRIYWWPEGGKIRFFNNLNGNISKIRILYVPGVEPDALVPDVVASAVIDGTVAKFREMPQEVVKKANDLNENKTPQTEVNKNALP